MTSPASIGEWNARSVAVETECLALGTIPGVGHTLDIASRFGDSVDNVAARHRT